jgi:cyclopropane-fatty-acyl-phospholipid synthase
MIDAKAAGSSTRAVAHHYDVGNDFFRLWLGPTMSYSCAAWTGGGTESLEAAQLRKIDGHLERAHAFGAPRLLDIGCGWGGALDRAIQSHQVRRATGLTLSPSQRDWIAGLGCGAIEVRLESWVDHRPDEPYDGIISIEALEAFARLGLPAGDKIEVYRLFFARCHEWLKPGGWCSLQTIAYGNSGPEDFDEFIAGEIFPETDLPRIAELAEAAERIFEIVELRNDRGDYVRTLDTWAARLLENRAAAVALVGEATVVRFQRYLKLSSYMFQTGACHLIRLGLRRIDQPKGRRPR